MRRATMDGIYDVHTNTMQYPQIMQPTHARWERVPPSDLGNTAELMSTLSIANKSMADAQSASAEPADSADKPDDQTQKSIFPPVPLHTSDRYLVTDMVYESPPYSNMGIPGPDGDLCNMNPNGLASIANLNHPEFMTPEILALLPDDCKDALIDAAAREIQWKSKWSTEALDGMRAQPSKSYAWYP
jgi:chromatin structure-remodeling complex protein RSC7